MKRRSTFALAVCAVLCLLVWARSGREGSMLRPSDAIEPAIPDASAAEDAEELAAPLFVGHRGQERVLVAPDRVALGISGHVRLPGDVPCRTGFALAWPDGLVPSPVGFLALAEGHGDGSLISAPIRKDGSFRLENLSSDTTYTLSAVSLGAACVRRPTGIAPGDTSVEMELMFTYGVAIRLEERGRSSLRTTPLLFGGGPRASGPDVKLQENPPELQVLSIAGLQPGHGTRDRWQYLAVSDVDSAAIGPIDYEVEVPGYRLRRELVAIPRLTDRLEEVVLELDPSASSWGEVEVRVLGSPQVPPIGLDPEEIIGVVYLSPPGQDPVEFALHARALGGSEVVARIPAGSYDAIFEARDAYYQTEAQRIEIGHDRCLLELDCSGSGTLLISVEDEGKVHDQRFVVSIQDEDRAQFYATFDTGPYVVPALLPGTYRIDELEVPGRECACLGGSEVTVLAGQVSVAFVACRAGLPAHAVR